MSFAARSLTQGVRRVLYTQAVLTLAVATAFGVAAMVGAPTSSATPVNDGAVGLSPEFYRGLSALYGGAVAMLSAWWLGRGMNSAGELARTHPDHGAAALYSRLLQRLVGMSLLLALGLGPLQLAPLPMVVCFAIAQLGYAAAARANR